MSEDSSVKQVDDIDLIDLFVVLLRYRKVILGLTLLSIIGVLIGYFIIPKKQSEQESFLEYTVEEFTVFPMASVVKYTLQGDDEKFRFILNKSELFLSNKIILLFKQPELIFHSLKRSGNEDLLISDDSVLDPMTIIKQNMVDLDAKRPKSLSLDETDWIYSVKSDSNSLNIIFTAKNLDKKNASAFLNSLYEIANETILDIIKPAAIAELNMYQNLIDSEGLNNLSDEILYDYSNAKAVLNGKIQPLFIVSELTFVEKDSDIPLTDRKLNYIKKGLIIVFAVFFLSIFLVFILEFMNNIKNDDERMKKIQNALGKN